MKSYSNEIYLCPKEKIIIDHIVQLTVQDVCEISGEDSLVDQIRKIVVCKEFHEKTIFVVSLLHIIKSIKSRYPDVKINVLNEKDVLVEVNNRQNNKLFYFIKVFFVCVLIFVGAGTAIMNFHADVNMDAVQRNFYEFITGKKVKRPLWVAIPYSVGIGVGMFIFFNHISLKDRKSSKPSPLDLELNSYQTTIDDYIRNRSKERRN